MTCYAVLCRKSKQSVQHVPRSLVFQRTARPPCSMHQTLRMQRELHAQRSLVQSMSRRRLTCCCRKQVNICLCGVGGVGVKSGVCGAFVTKDMCHSLAAAEQGGGLQQLLVDC